MLAYAENGDWGEAAKGRGEKQSQKKREGETGGGKKMKKEIQKVAHLQGKSLQLYISLSKMIQYADLKTEPFEGS